MQFKDYKKYLKRLIDLKKIVNPDDLDFKDKVDAMYEDLKREAIDKNYKAILFNLFILENGNGVDDIYLTGNNKYKISGRMFFMKGRYNDVDIDRLDVDFENYPRLRLLMNQGVARISPATVFYYVMVEIKIDLKNLDFNVDDVNELSNEVLDCMSQYREGVENMINEDRERRMNMEMGLK